MSKVTVQWEVEDGYVGKARPQSFTVDADEMAMCCETEKEADEYLKAELAQDFESKITPRMRNRDDVIAAWRAARKSWTKAEA